MRNNYLAMKSQFKENNFASSKFRYSFIFNFPFDINAKLTMPARSLLFSHLGLVLVLDDGGPAGVTLSGHVLRVVILEPALLRRFGVSHEALVDQDVEALPLAW